MVTLSILNAKAVHSHAATFPVAICKGEEDSDHVDAMIEKVHFTASWLFLKHDEQSELISCHSALSRQLAEQLQRLSKSKIFYPSSASDDNNRHSADVQLWWGGDQKMLSLLLGLAGPMSKHWCCWCGLERSERHCLDMTKLEAKKHARTVEFLRQAGESASQMSSTSSAAAFARGAGKGVIREAALLAHHHLLSDIQFVVPDLLHLLLRTVERVVSYMRASFNNSSTDNFITRCKACSIGTLNFYKGKSGKWRVKLNGKTFRRIPRFW